MLYRFKSKEEVLEMARIYAMCDPGSAWMRQQPDLETIFRDMALEHRLSAIARGAVQFEENCPWREVSGHDWMILLVHRADLEGRCTEFGGWEKISKEDFCTLLRRRPEFVRYRRTP